MPSSNSSETATETATPRARNWRMFDRIAGSYDLGNRLLSGRRDVAWRRRLLASLPSGEDLRVLDLATGTGDVLMALACAPERYGCAQAVGIDMSSGMLRRAQAKFERLTPERRPALARADALCLPMGEARFDAVTVAFGVRNMADVPAALGEALRILRPGGRLLVLEFSTPTNPLFRPLYLAYLRHVLPRIGGWLSGDAAAYRYLNTTIESFPSGEAFCGLMRTAGFARVSATPLTLGIATLYQGEKPDR